MYNVRSGHLQTLSGWSDLRTILINLTDPRVRAKLARPGWCHNISLLSCLWPCSTWDLPLPTSPPAFQHSHAQPLVSGYISVSCLDSGGLAWCWSLLSPGVRWPLQWELVGSQCRYSSWHRLHSPDHQLVPRSLRVYTFLSSLSQLPTVHPRQSLLAGGGGPSVELVTCGRPPPLPGFPWCEGPWRAQSDNTSPGNITSHQSVSDTGPGHDIAPHYQHLNMSPRSNNTPRNMVRRPHRASCSTQNCDATGRTCHQPGQAPELFIGQYLLRLSHDCSSWCFPWLVLSPLTN